MAAPSLECDQVVSLAPVNISKYLLIEAAAAHRIAEIIDIFQAALYDRPASGDEI